MGKTRDLFKMRGFETGLKRLVGERQY